MAPKHPNGPRDLNQWAKRMVDIATGEAGEEPETGVPVLEATKAAPQGRGRSALKRGPILPGRRRGPLEEDLGGLYAFIRHILPQLDVKGQIEGSWIGSSAGWAVFQWSWS